MPVKASPTHHPTQTPAPAHLTRKVPAHIFTKASTNAYTAISAHPVGPQPGVSGRKHRSLHSPAPRVGPKTPFAAQPLRRDPLMGSYRCRPSCWLMTVNEMLKLLARQDFESRSQLSGSHAVSSVMVKKARR